MSDQSFSQKPDGERIPHLQFTSMPFSVQSPQQLAQFTAATAAGYHPKPQLKTSTSGVNTNNTAHQTIDKTKMSAFAASAYEAAEKGLQTPTTIVEEKVLQTPTTIVEEKVFKPPAAQSIDLSTFKGFSFLTLDALVMETRDIYDKISGTFQWEMCESQEDRCINFLRDKCNNRRVFFITSGSLGSKIVPMVHELPQVYCIYVYCGDIDSHKKWADKYSKVRVVCNDDDRYLLPQLAVDVAQANIDWGDAFVKQGNRDKAKEKFQKALDNLNNHAKKPDPNMVKQAKTKLDECK